MRRPDSPVVTATPRPGPGRAMAARVLRTLPLALWLTGSSAACAADASPGLADPTRPSARPSAPPPAAGRPAASAPVPAAALPPPLLLQSLQLPQRGLASALVDGRMVVVGDEIGGRRVLAIDPQGLLLQGKAGAERLPLLAGSPKQPAGSIVVQRSASFFAPPKPEPGATTAAPTMQPPPSHAPGVDAEHPQPTPVSLAGRTPP